MSSKVFCHDHQNRATYGLLDDISPEDLAKDVRDAKGDRNEQFIGTGIAAALVAIVGLIAFGYGVFELLKYADKFANLRGW